tara:strand:- start:1722 stop:2885 length:1164 start_codon:yes stop_codon:yes gene_type:complete
MVVQTHLILHNLLRLLEIISSSLLILLIVIFVSLKTTKVQAQAVEIGDISELSGSASVVRDQPYDATVNFGIQTNDEAITNNGRMAIKFLDDSQVKLTEHSQLLINEYVFDPDPDKSKMALTFALGTTRFITGNLNRINKQNISLQTPTANIAIRGTDFTATVNELGESLIILLPDAYGISSGEIEVITATGSVILNQPFQATTVDVFESAPTKPVILDLTLDLIDNMLIVSPPDEVVIESEDVILKSDSIYDFNDLDIDYLDEDFLDNEAELEFTELDINYLDVNFLEDLLDVLDALEVAEEEDQLSQDIGSISITGTKFGQDPDTQIISFIDGEKLTLIRSVNNTARVDLDTNGSYTVIFIQDGVSKTIKINGGSSSVITIRQSQ